MYYFHNAKDLNKAKEVLTELDNVYPDERVTFEAHMLMSDNKVDVKTFYSEYYKQETHIEKYFTIDIKEVIQEKI